MADSPATRFRLLHAGAALIVGATLIAASSTGGEVPPIGDAPITYAVIGDSLTAGADHVLTVSPTPRTWPWFVNQSQDFSYSGGWAVSAARSDQLAETMPDEPVDVLIVLSGANDVMQGQDFAIQLEALEEMSSKSGGDVVLLALPPHTAFYGTDRIERRNRELQTFAKQKDWMFFNPWTSFVTADYQWREGQSADGVHPSATVQAEAGDTLRQYLERTYR